MKNLTDLPLEIPQAISSLLSLRDSIALNSTCISLSRINEIKYYFEYDEKEVEHRTRRALSMESVESLMKITRIKQITIDYFAAISRVLVTRGLLEELKFLLKDERTDHITLFQNSCWFGKLEIVEMLMNEFKVDPSSLDNEAIRYATMDNDGLRLASAHGRFGVVEFLLQDSRVDPSAHYNDAIRYACIYGHSRVAELLLKDSRVDPSDSNNFVYASEEGYDKVLELLLQDSRVDPSAYDNKAIRLASSKVTGK